MTNVPLHWVLKVVCSFVVTFYLLLSSVTHKPLFSFLQGSCTETPKCRELKSNGTIGYYHFLCLTAKILEMESNLGTDLEVSCGGYVLLLGMTEGLCFNIFKLKASASIGNYF